MGQVVINPLRSIGTIRPTSIPPGKKEPLGGSDVKPISYIEEGKHFPRKLCHYIVTVSTSGEQKVMSSLTTITSF